MAGHFVAGQVFMAVLHDRLCGQRRVLLDDEQRDDFA